jgi:hypothetical protein
LDHFERQQHGIGIGNNVTWFIFFVLLMYQSSEIMNEHQEEQGDLKRSAADEAKRRTTIFQQWSDKTVAQRVQSELFRDILQQWTEQWNEKSAERQGKIDEAETVRLRKVQEKNEKRKKKREEETKEEADARRTSHRERMAERRKKDKQNND